MSARLAWWRRLLARPIEYLTLRRALDAADRLPQERRLALAQAATEASQKRDAAETLLSRGSCAESIRLATESARLLDECLQAVTDSSPVGTKRVRRATEDMEWASARHTPPPALDGQVTRAQKAALRTLLSAELALAPPLGEALLVRRRLRVLRVQRIVTAVLVALSPLAALAFVRGSFLGLTARASGQLDDQYTADRVLDGDPDTEWVAAGGEEWLEIRFRSRTVHSLRILNGDTLPGRAVKTMHVDFYNGNESHATSPRTFKQEYPAQSQYYDVGGVKCDRIRIVITEHFGASAAIAEVEIN